MPKRFARERPSNAPNDGDGNDPGKSRVTDYPRWQLSLWGLIRTNNSPTREYDGDRQSYRDEMPRLHMRSNDQGKRLAVGQSA